MTGGGFGVPPGRRYEILRSLGQGAMGEVFLARDSVLDRFVALKQLRSDAVEAMGTTSVDRMMREARMAAQLRHPNIVVLYDIEVAESPRLIMEYVDGESLQKLLDRVDRLSTAQAAAVFAPIASALAAAHARGITHRDVKPANVLIGTAAEGADIKLTDFGVAVSATDVAPGEEGHVVGTLAYMAPEAARTGSTNSATDVWSLGASLYAAVEGRPPYARADRETYTSLLRRIVTEPIPRPRQAGGLDRLLDSMLAADAARRPSAMDVSRQLAEHAATAPAAAGAPRRRKKRRFAALGAVLVAAAVVAASLLWFGRDHGSAEVRRNSTPFTTDGSQLWLTVRTKGAVVLDTKSDQVLEPAIMLTTKPVQRRAIVDSPRDRAYALVGTASEPGCGNAIAVLDTGSRRLVKVIALDHDLCAFIVTSDGRYLAGVDPYGVALTVDTASGHIAELGTPSTGAAANPKVLGVPDSHDFLTLSGTGQKVTLWSADTGSRVRTFGASGALDFDLSPDGSSVYVAGPGGAVDCYPTSGGAARWTDSVRGASAVRIAGTRAVVVTAYDGARWTLQTIRAGDGGPMSASAVDARPSLLRIDIDASVADSFFSTVTTSAGRTVTTNHRVHLADGKVTPVEGDGTPLTISDDGSRYYEERLTQRLLVIDTSSGRIIDTVPLGGS